VHVGIVGCGRIGETHLCTCLAHPGVNQVDVIDPLGLPDQYRSASLRWSPVLDDADVEGWDAAIVATPTPDHAAVVAQLLDHGIPTLCEKPISLDPDVTADLGHRATTNGVALRSGLQRRFDPATVAVRDLLTDGALGDPLWASSSTRDPQPPPPAYLHSSGGIFLDMHIHDIDILIWSLGSTVAEVTATGSAVDQPELAGTTDHGTTTIALQTHQGVLATVTGSRWSAPGYAVELTILGRAGQAHMDPTGHLVLRTRHHTTTIHPGQTTIPPGFTDRYAHAYQAEVNAFLAEVTGTEPACANWTDDHAAVTIALAATQSAHTGQRIAITGKPD
jgi:myo-inositol 2-dehydrogenase / D-chiro-inositol 1-dehydrogenase